MPVRGLRDKMRMAMSMSAFLSISLSVFAGPDQAIWISHRGFLLPCKPAQVALKSVYLPAHVSAG